MAIVARVDVRRPTPAHRRKWTLHIAHESKRDREGCAANGREPRMAVQMRTSTSYSTVTADGNHRDESWELVLARRGSRLALLRARRGAAANSAKAQKVIADERSRGPWRVAGETQGGPGRVHVFARARS